MATIKVEYCCGCKFKTEDLLEAVIHSDKKGHSLIVQGKITKDKEEGNGKTG